MSQEETNPLRRFIRQPQIYIRLPSGGRFSKDKIEFTATGDVPVRAPTARDNLLMKNPDALLNGDAVEGTIKSCVPEIHNIRELPINDIDALTLAIRFAADGDNFEFTLICPKCGKDTKFSRSIRQMLDTATDIPEVNIATISEKDENGNPVTVEIMLRPHTYENQLRISLADFDSQKRLAFIRSRYDHETAEGTDEEKLARTSQLEVMVRSQMKEIFASMADTTLHLMIEAVAQITITDSKGPIVITDRKDISEYIWNLDDHKNKILQKKMEEVMSYGVDKSYNAVCSHEDCKHEWHVEEVGYDQSNFSDTSS